MQLRDLFSYNMQHNIFEALKIYPIGGEGPFFLLERITGIVVGCNKDLHMYYCTYTSAQSGLTVWKENKREQLCILMAVKERKLIGLLLRVPVAVPVEC